ncbi:peptide deformylase [Eggerthella lenta]|uniref:peptide deformylase n=1 Tax=Eggerthella lenta TaxID=84112 RepID=UPI000DF7EC66|nr:peptide deformylase [Eggerthella lenta]RDC14416.1 peptide deformylase [Eggerthella lenta]
MIRPIMRNVLVLQQPSQEATEADLPVAQDLLDTLEAHRHSCVGMAANMIGELKRIIAFDNDGSYLVMLNPEIVSRAGEYAVEEGCLSLAGTRPAVRYRTIKVRYQDLGRRRRTGTFTGFTAQIVQHEIDHCNGILI